MQTNKSCMYLLVLIFLAVFVGIGSVSPVSLLAEEVQVAAYDNYYEPAQVTIEAGDTVVWTNKGQNNHTVTSGTNCSPSDQFSQWIAPGETFSYTFEEQGEQPYFCIPHCAMGMTGTVVVK